MNELLGRSMWAPIIFGCAAPDTGNAEIIAAYGTPEQKEKWLQPLLDGEVFSCYSMTEPHGGSDPTQFKCRAERDGDEWVINGDKFFSSNLRTASFIIVMCVTNPDVHPYQGMSMILVPSDTPGIRVLQDIGHLGQTFGGGMHAHVRYENVRVPYENLLGGEGKAFEVAQRRLGGGRIHHAMRTVATCQRYFEMMCERALSRTTKGDAARREADGAGADRRVVDRAPGVPPARALHRVAHRQLERASRCATTSSACKVRASQIMSTIGSRATHLHGALGVSNLMPLGGNGEIMATVDGPTEVHYVTVARQVMKQHKPSPDNWPTMFRPRRAAREPAAVRRDRRSSGSTRRRAPSSTTSCSTVRPTTTRSSASRSTWSSPRTDSACRSALMASGEAKSIRGHRGRSTAMSKTTGAFSLGRPR